MKAKKVEAYPKSRDGYWTEISLGNSIAISYTVDENGECARALVSDLRDGTQIELDFSAQSLKEVLVSALRKVGSCLSLKNTSS